MPSPNATFTEMVTTTLRKHYREVVDNITGQNALLTYLKERGKIKTVSGGYEIAVPLDYAENSTYQRYAGYDPLNTAASDVLSAAKYDWAQIALHVVASGREVRMNNGEEQMIGLVKSRIKNAQRTAANNMSVDLYSDGSLANQIAGLAAQITSDGTGTIGGINATTFPFWKNKFKEATGTGTYAEIVKDMNALWLQLVRGTDAPDLIVYSHDLYAAYENTQQQLQRYSDAKLAGAGFETLKYKSANVIFDTNTNFGTTSETGYFLNTDYIELIQHADAKWTQDEQKVPTNQDAIIIPIYWMGQLTTSNRSLQGKLIDAA
jgi:hypothetical protein